MMSDRELGSSTEYLDELLKELAVEMNSENVEEMKRLITAFDRVDNVLHALEEQLNLQVSRGSNVVEDYRRSRGIDEVVETHLLDYIIRIENVEMQIDINISIEDVFSISREKFLRFFMILGKNPKTEEIIIVWDSEDLHSLSLGIDDIQYYISNLENNEDVYVIRPEDLKSMRETIIDVLEKYRPEFRTIEDFEKVKKQTFNIIKEFNDLIHAEINELRETINRRRSEEIITAIKSISEKDLDEIKKLFVEVINQGLSYEEIDKKISDISEKVISEKNQKE